MNKLKIVWSNQAQDALKDIYDYYKDKSEQGAQHVRLDLLNAPKKIVFAQQYQVDEINPKFRRIVVSDFKLLYKESNNTIMVVDIISTRQLPELLKDK